MSGRIRLGIAGWGAAGRLMAAAVERSAEVALAGVADVDAVARERAAADVRVPVHDDLEALVARADVDAVYLATPTDQHAGGVALAAAHRTHVVCEKPIAPTLEAALAASAAARAAGIVLIVGATHAFDAPVRALRSLVERDDLGSLLAVESTQHGDWHRRPRSPHDLDLESGNGLVLRQGAHQLDVVRHVAGGDATSVAGDLFGGTAGRERGFVASVRFRGGALGSVFHSATGGFDSRLQSWGVGELGTVELAPAGPLADHFVLPGAAAIGPVAPVLGRTIATFERGGALLTARGLLVFGPDGVSETTTGHLPSAWDAVLAELDGALRGDPPLHGADWGVATLEACLAVHESAATGSAVALRHQVHLPPPARLERP